jgi:hypothetical protein
MGSIGRFKSQWVVVSFMMLLGVSLPREGAAQRRVLCTRGRPFTKRKKNRIVRYRSGVEMTVGGEHDLVGET